MDRTDDNDISAGPSAAPAAALHRLWARLRVPWSRSRANRSAGSDRALRLLAVSALPSLALLGAVAAGSGPPPWWGAGLVGAQVGAATWLLLAAGQGDRRADLRAATELGMRAYQAEAALEHEHDRLHELRATIRGITLASELLRDRSNELSASAQLRLELLQDAELGRLQRMLGDRVPDLELVELDPVIRPLVDVLRLQGHRPAWAGTDLQVWGRRDHLTEVVHVLLTNAVRHGEGRGIAVEVVAVGDSVLVHVRDLGPGVRPGLADTLFDRGVRAIDSPGRGIGLHIARRLAHEMGGELRLAPPGGRPGAWFVLSLPAVTRDAVTPARSA